MELGRSCPVSWGCVGQASPKYGGWLQSTWVSWKEETVTVLLCMTCLFFVPS